MNEKPWANHAIYIQLHVPLQEDVNYQFFFTTSTAFLYLEPWLLTVFSGTMLRPRSAKVDITLQLCPFLPWEHQWGAEQLQSIGSAMELIEGTLKTNPDGTTADGQLIFHSAEGTFQLSRQEDGLVVSSKIGLLDNEYLFLAIVCSLILAAIGALMSCMGMVYVPKCLGHSLIQQTVPRQTAVQSSK
jgi:hypothetical protein